MMKIPRSAKIRIDAQGQALKGIIEFADKDTITLDNVDSINTVLRNIYEKEDKNLGDLINEKRIIISSSKVWDKYNLSNGKFFIKNDKVKEEPTVVSSPVATRSDPVMPSEPVYDTPVVDEEKKDDEDVVVTDPVVSEDAPVDVSDSDITDDLDDEDKKDEPVVSSDGAIDVTDTRTSSKSKTKSKTKVKLKKIAVGALAIIVGGYILCGGLKNLFKKNNNINDNKKNDDRNVDTTPVQDSTTTLSTDEELIPTLTKEPSIIKSESEIVHSKTDTDEYETGYVDSSEFVEVGPVYDFSDKGSNVRYDDMPTQLDTINALCDSHQPCELENLVVTSDYDAIHTICSMRNDVLNGRCSPEYFTNCIIDYAYENSTVFGNIPIKEFTELSAYGKYIVIVASNTILPLCNENYVYTVSMNEYRLSDLYGDYDYTINDLYRFLTDNTKSK